MVPPVADQVQVLSVVVPVTVQVKLCVAPWATVVLFGLTVTADTTGGAAVTVTVAVAGVLLEPVTVQVKLCVPFTWTLGILGLTATATAGTVTVAVSLLVWSA